MVNPCIFHMFLLDMRVAILYIRVPYSLLICVAIGCLDALSIISDVLFILLGDNYLFHMACYMLLLFGFVVCV